VKVIKTLQNIVLLMDNDVYHNQYLKYETIMIRHFN